MTREERAVEILKNELACVRNVYCERSECRNCNLVMPEHEITEALQMAIKALEQEPCDDAISREDAMMALTGEWIEPTDELIHRFIKRIKNLPPVTPQPKTGHWIKKEDDTCWWYVCSECEQEPLKNRWNDDDVLSRFCPNCGCRMIEP